MLFAQLNSCPTIYLVMYFCMVSIFNYSSNIPPTKHI